MITVIFSTCFLHTCLCVCPITTQYCILTHYRYIAVENIVRNREIACIKRFLLFSQCFLLYMVLIYHLNCTLKCCLQLVSIWTSLKFCCLVIGYLLLIIGFDLYDLVQVYKDYPKQEDHDGRVQNLG